eukprot:gene25369-27488_t
MQTGQTDVAAELPELSISTEDVCCIISMARQFDAKDAVTEPDPDSNATDDGNIAVLEDHSDDPVEAELTTFIHDLNIDAQIDLVALTWLGRGDREIEGWAELRADAAQAHNSRTAAYLLGIPLLSDFLSEALSVFGRSCDDLDAERL